MVGWGLLMWLVVTRVYAANPELARQLLMPPLVTWFCVDSTFSVLSGAPLNVAGNVLFLLLFLLPLSRSRIAE